MKNFVEAHSLLTDFDISLFRSGKHFRMYEKFGAHVIEVNGQKGTYFAVWAPNAESVSVIGNFNFWSGDEHQLHVRWDSSGIWEGFIPNLTEGEIYKYRIKPNGNGEVLENVTLLPNMLKFHRILLLLFGTKTTNGKMPSG